MQLGSFRYHGATIGSVASGLGGQALLVVSGVALARALGPEDRGYLALLMAVPLAVTQLVGAGTPEALPYFLAPNPSLRPALLKVLAGPIAVQTFGAVLVQAAALFVLSGSTSGRFLSEGWPVLVVPPALLGVRYAQGLLLSERRFYTVNVLRLVPTAVNSAGVLALYLVRLGSLWAMTLVGACAFVIAAAAGAIAASRSPVVPARANRGGAPDAVSRWTVLRFGLLISLPTMAPIETFRLDQLIVGLLLSPIALGLYVVALSFANLPHFVAQSVGLVAYPSIASARDARGVRAAFRSFVFVSLVLSAGATLALELLAPPLIGPLFGSAFASAGPLAQTLILASFVRSARRVLADACRGVGRVDVGLIGEITAWLVLIGGVAIFGRLGVDAMATAVLLSALASYVAVVPSVVRVLRSFSE